MATLLAVFQGDMNSGPALPVEELQHIERHRDQERQKNPESGVLKSQLRARVVRNCLYMLPGESILVFAEGHGDWAEHLAAALKGRNPITALVFSPATAADTERLERAGVKVISPAELGDMDVSFDYVVGTSVLTRATCDESLRAIFRWLKPRGQILLFEPNHDRPATVLQNSAAGGRLPKLHLLRALKQAGFVEPHIQPYDIVPDWMSPEAILATKSKLLVLEHIPFLGVFCNTRLVWAVKPGPHVAKPLPNLAEHTQFFGAVSVVVPCHNEEMNIPELVASLTGMYGPYIHEILLVNDNSRDRTADVIREISQTDSRVKLIDRSPPNGVGRALRDGYAAATGSLILSMDCDFVQLLPGLKDLFDRMAAGHDGAIGSRFSHESVLVNYPSFKVLCNRITHVLLKFLAPRNIRDITNNLKLYRAEVFKSIEILEPHFAANLETGLMPILAGYDIREVPTSWINRKEGMGISTFKLLNVGPPYLRVIWRVLRGRFSKKP